MRQISLALFFIVLLGTAFNICNASEKNEKQPPELNLSIDKLQTDVQMLKEAVQEIRRDKLNYRIEKDLLKDVYSSNLVTV